MTARIRQGTALAVGLALAATSPAGAASFTSLHSFNGGADGAQPYGRLVRAPSGLLYGTTLTAGANGGGTIFSFDPVSLVVTTLHNFTTYGADGANPQTGLILSKKGVLYGVATQGGTGAACQSRCGTIFAYDTVSGNFSVLYHFTGLADGYLPEGALTFDKKQKVLYGTAAAGGDFADNCGNLGCGTVFSFTLATGVLKTLHAFIPADGALPQTRLAIDAAGTLYGTTSEAGAHGSGTVFSIPSAGGALAVLHAFEYHVDGNSPDSDLLYSKGLLTGTTSSGGATDAADGTIFRMAPDGSGFVTLYNFMGAADGRQPRGGLAVGPKGLLYGTAGSQNGAGEVFSFAAASGKVKQLYQFTGGADGAEPQSGLIYDGVATLYGVSSYGNGTIFQIIP